MPRRNVGTISIEIQKPLIGIVGLGRIGGAIAKLILGSGYPVLAWARRPEALSRLVGQGGVIAPTLAQVGKADVVISVVFDDDAAREVALGPNGFIDALGPGAVHVAMETISPGLSRGLADAHAQRGQRYLAAPVFGRPEAAERGELAIMCSGPEAVYRSVAPVLAAAGRTRWIGPEPEQAMLVKLTGNHMILTMAELLGETFSLLRAGGVSGSETKAALLDELMPGIFAGYAQRLVDTPDAPRPAASAIGRKDNGLVLEAARALGIDLPLAEFLGSR